MMKSLLGSVVCVLSLGACTEKNEEHPATAPEPKAALEPKAELEPEPKNEPEPEPEPRVEPGEFQPRAITLREVPDSQLKELVGEDLRFTDASGTVWTAPKGTLTDGASVPRLALWVTDGRFDSRFLKAAVVHDAYCQPDNKERAPQQYQTRPWRAVHRMFYEACLAGGTPEQRASIMFAAVWLGGPRWDDPERDLDNVPDSALRKEFDACETWITQNDPSVAEIEDWMDRREAALLKQR